MKSIIKKLGFELSMVVILALLIGIEHVLAATFGWTVNGMSYAEYSLMWMKAHPFLNMFLGFGFGYLTSEIVNALLKD